MIMHLLYINYYIIYITFCLKARTDLGQPGCLVTLLLIRNY